MSDRTESIFHEARDLPPDQRAAYLDAACAGDAALRERVAALLAADDQAGAFLDTVADPDATTSMAGGVPRPVGPGEAAGDVIGPYRLLQPLGEGGFGSVWMAEQKTPVRRRVALKIIKLGMDTKQVIARFEAERQALAMMDHPNIAKVFDAGSTESGRPYFVMELVKGVPIVEYCDRGRLGGRERLELFILVCRAIQHAHQKGIIHRDIKPGNVLVTLHDGVPVPKVIDFGIAKATNQELTGRTLFTEYQQIVGTPAYMSPEQAELSGLDIDTRSDIYSLGVLLYELLTGTTPFDAKTLLKRGYGEMMRVIREETPHKPSTRLSTLGEQATSAAQQRHTDVRRLGMMLRGDLDWIVMKCLEKDRTRRYETANGLAEDIARHLRSEPVTAGPPSAAYRARKFVRRNRTGVLATGLLAGALLVGGVGTSVGLVWALRERDRADAAAEQARLSELEAVQRAEQVERISRFQADQLTGIDVPRMGVGLLEALGDEVRAIDESRSKSPEEVLRRQEDLRALLAGVDFTGVALDSLRENIFAPALDAIEGGFSDQPALEASLLLTLGDTAWKLGAFDFALAPLEQSVRIRTEQFGEADPRTIDARVNLAILTKDLGRFDEAGAMYDRIIEQSTAANGADDRVTVRAMLNHAVYLTAIDQHEKAEPGLRAAVAWYRDNAGPMHEDTLGSMNSLAVALSNQGRFDEAEPLYRACVDGYTQTEGPTARRTIIARNNLGTFYLHREEYTKAESLYRELLVDARKGLGDDHDNTIMILDNLGNVINAQGRPAEAMDYAMQAFETRRRVLGENHPATLRSHYNIAVLQRNLGRLGESETNFRRAVEGFRLVYGEAHPYTSTAWTSLGGLLLQQQRWEDVEREMLVEYRALEPLGGERAIARRTRVTGALAKFYAMWHEAEPDAGHDAEAAVWEARAAELKSGG